MRGLKCWEKLGLAWDKETGHAASPQDCLNMASARALYFLTPDRYDSRYETIHSFSRCLRSSFASKRIPTLLLGFFQET